MSDCDCSDCAQRTGSNVVPLWPADAGRRVARAALDAEAVSTRLYNLERAALVLLDRAQRMRRGYEDTGELVTCGASEALDQCAVWMAGVRDA
jgi:hypothetical protein